MSILASLVKAYDRLPDAPPFGFSSEKVGFLISLNADGSVAHVIDLREGEGKKKHPRLLPLPASFKRPGTTPRAFFLWDNTAYALGISADDEKDCEARRLAFRDLHTKALKDATDTGLLALRRFLSEWEPSDFARLKFPEEMKGHNIIFALEAERHRQFLHEGDAARSIWAKMSASDDKAQAICLVTGEMAPVARLHQAIKGVWGGQVAGGSIVSFNLQAFESYGHEQGDNAPVSESSAFAYTTVLNRFLERDSGHRIQIGDASTVFWGDASAAKSDAARLAESVFGVMFDGPDEEMQSSKVGDVLEKIREGRPVASFDPELSEAVRFYVLGLAPNAARLSIRFYFEDRFGTLAGHYQKFVSDMRIVPGPRDGYPPLWRYLLETAVLGKRENVTPNLAGEWMRSILSGANYPLTLMSSVLTRIRADGEVNALRVGILKALLVRNFKMEVPVGLDETNDNKGYLLGRLFATYEQIQTAALGSKVNATIKDKYYGSASAQPRKVFSMLESGSANHLSKVGKQKPGYKVVLERQVSAIMALMDPGKDPFPASLSPEQQALFGLGYYHQKFTRKETEATASGETAE